MDDGVTIKLDGARALHDALGELKKSTERGLLRRVASNALQPIINRAKELAPVDDGDLRDSLVVGGTLSKNARKAARAEPVDGVRVFAGTARRTAVAREFGSSRSRAQPFLRPAWEGGKERALNDVIESLAVEIEKTRARAARRKKKD